MMRTWGMDSFSLKLFILLPNQLCSDTDVSAAVYKHSVGEKLDLGVIRTGDLMCS